MEIAGFLILPTETETEPPIVLTIPKPTDGQEAGVSGIGECRTSSPTDNQEIISDTETDEIIEYGSGQEAGVSGIGGCRTSSPTDNQEIISDTETDDIIVDGRTFLDSFRRSQQKLDAATANPEGQTMATDQEIHNSIDEYVTGIIDKFTAMRNKRMAETVTDVDSKENVMDKMNSMKKPKRVRMKVTDVDSSENVMDKMNSMKKPKRVRMKVTDVDSSENVEEARRVTPCSPKCKHCNGSLGKKKPIAYKSFESRMETKADLFAISGTMEVFDEVNRNLTKNLYKLIEIRNEGKFTNETKEIIDKQVITEINTTKNTVGELYRILFPLKQTLTRRQNGGPSSPAITYDNTNNIWQAITKKKLQAVKFYYEGFPSVLTRKNFDGYTPILWAAKHGVNDIIEYLLSVGDSLDVFDYHLRNPLLCAAHAGFDLTVKLLLDQGVDINYQDGDKNTALHLAIEKSKWDVHKLLIERGADENLKNTKNFTAKEMLFLKVIRNESLHCL